MKFQILLILSLLITLNACNEPTTQIATTTTKKVEVPEFFKTVLDAHGGLDRWNEMNTLKFSGTRRGSTTDYTIDLKSRKEIIELKGKYKLGNDGDKVWVSPVRDSFPGRSPRFMKNLVFYFVGLPFVLADEGVDLSDQGIQKIDDKEYQVIKAAFGEGVGDAPEDVYVLYVNPKTSIIDFITYSVTYFDQKKSTKYNALKYNWKNVNGLLFPESYVGYKWEDGKLGEKRYESPFANSSFSKEKIEDSMFAIPEGAHVE